MATYSISPQFKLAFFCKDSPLVKKIKGVLTVLSSRYMVFDKKSIPIVACKKEPGKKKKYFSGNRSHRKDI